MLRMLVVLFVSLLIYIPHTSIQDIATPVEDRPNPTGSAAVTTTTTSVTDIANLIETLSEQEYEYETAYYALALTNVLPNFAKLFHERGEQKRADVKGLVRLCQVLNLEVNYKSVLSNPLIRPLRLLSPETINKTNVMQFFSELKSSECETTFKRLSAAYRMATDMSVPLQMYLKDKLYMKQVSTCKHTSDLFVQLDRFVDASSNEKAIPFSFMYVDSRAKQMLTP